MSGTLSKNLGTNDRLRAIHLWEDPTFPLKITEFTVAPSAEEFHPIPPGMYSMQMI
ncbi:hypothetical protein LEP1GSC203_0799 [Leptospira terpstrae serovar Hualin str. LT 11-33 = ATCC 700639]|uniref:Uncharacterized protein n=1 Tax=Leptospira terpstrae serovar Hualin str. LT 11-33 = ATCC 700639 TaxID=1257025 RepID=N1VNI3_9LEPT|nr:hypothetical protein LEP1GSC203_0799 [Leptospira terpstrae serovar Hualin str. LT 11-33 = ATCC 700639]